MSKPSSTTGSLPTSSIPPEQDEWSKSGAQFQAKRNSEYLDPCQEAANRSLKCLRRNGGARDMCTDYFDAYRECKKRWMEQLKEEKRKQGGWFGSGSNK